jgi:hypothetical protein
MALLTDRNPNDTEALRVYETSILNVAHVESIDLDAKLSLATEEIAQEVMDVLLGHIRGNDDSGSRRRTMGVADVVVTPQLKRWHALHTLEVIYRDAYNNQLNDRYRHKWEEYRRLSCEAKEQTTRFGIGLCANPIPQAGPPRFDLVADLVSATTYYVRVSWVSGTGQEGLPSDVTTFRTVEGSLMAVEAVNAPPAAAAWNLYAGLTDTTLSRQNAVPVSIGQTFTVPASGLASGPAPGEGQAPDIYVTGGRLLRRG